ncbi:MAG TPA: glycosyltransferase family 2 protein [Verrucomicrobiae bacterium]|nr:glycosyltransferase family 2 protein [Verrucomicrobiae bacterium]
MDWSSQCAAIIPCLNEAAAIGPLITAVHRHLPSVIVVDDASTDDTQRIASEAGADVVRQPQTLGKGAALIGGWERALERGFSWALTLDGDGQHSPDDIPAFFDEANTGRADLIIGNRMANANGMPWLRRRVNQWMSRRLSEAAGQLLPDSQCGYRLLRLDTLCELDLRTTHFEIESEVLLAFVRAGYAVKFVTIQVIYRGERSKILPVRDTARWFRWYLRARRPRVPTSCDLGA